MHSPIVAMLWENWRLSRVEAAQRFAVGLLAASGAMVVGAGVPAAFTFLIAVHAFFWFSIAKLNGGKFMDGYKPGFPLYLLFTRPVPTAVLVGVTVAYDAVSCLALYLVSAAIISLVFGQPLPLFSVALFLVTIHFAFICIQWSTRNRTFQWVGSIIATAPLFLIIKDRLTSPPPIDFSLAENALMLLICAVSFFFTVAGVSRQRSGDTEEKAPSVDGMGGHPPWLINVFRVPCPTSSPTKAQLWFELKASGLPVLTLGLTASLLIFLLFAIGVRFTAMRDAAVGIPLMFVLFLLFGLGGNAFGIRKKQGRTFISAIESTLPYGVAQMAALKILVRTVCMVIALGVIGVSVWVSSGFMEAWSPWTYPEGGKNVVAELLAIRQKVGAAFGRQPGHVVAAFMLIAAIVVGVVIATLAIFAALRARYARRVLVVIALLMLCALGLVVLVWAVSRGVVPDTPVNAILPVVAVAAGMAMVVATAWLLWSGFSERLLTVRYVSGVLVFTAVSAAAWVIAVLATGGRLAAPMLWLALVPLMPSILAPWSLHRVRTG